MKSLEDLNKEDLIRLYWGEKKSLRDIAEIYNCHKSTISKRMDTWDIPKRNLSESRNVVQEIEDEKIRKKMIEDIKSLEPIKYDFKPRENIWIPLPLRAFSKNKAGQGRLTFVISDTHLGDTDHLPETYWSTIYTLTEILRVLKKRFEIPGIDVVLNGDIVCGKDVFKNQQFRTLVTRGHWQVSLAEMILKDTFELIEEVLPIKNLYFLKGTHEQAGENYQMYLKRTFPRAKYAGHHLVLNIGQDLGSYNVLITHGYGSSEYYPISYGLIRDMWKAISQYKKEGVPIERVCIGHYHWLNIEQNFESFVLDCTGGFQRWEFTVSQRPTGALLYFYYDGEVSAIPVRADQEIVEKEVNDPGLEYKNMQYYSKKLLKHLREVEGIKI